MNDRTRARQILHNHDLPRDFKALFMGLLDELDDKDTVLDWYRNPLTWDTGYAIVEDRGGRAHSIMEKYRLPRHPEQGVK